ncbi:MAG: S-methyl-5'-thioadenosine phosphorylase, partial [Deltaproteobacteria bacterium]|nr:S-methyl-5'-thioadenosine phosphorylase [Deltaproteobacteria bacterium]
EGPQFSSRGESLVYRSYGVDVIGMTNMPEAKLAREAEICYATIAVATDYDCWHASEEAVNVDMVIKALMNATEKAKRLILETISRIGGKEACRCGESLKYAIVTDRNSLSDGVKKEYELLLGKYL